MRMNTLSRWFVAAGVTAGLTFSGSSAFAASSVATCTAGLEALGVKLSSDVSKNLSGCVDAIRKEMVKGAKGKLANGAKACEAKLAAIYGSGKALASFKTKCAALSPAKCSDNDLVDMSHLLSGSGGSAPGTGSIGFTCDYLAMQVHEAALQEQLAQVPDFFAVLAAGRTAPDTKLDKGDGTKPCDGTGTGTARPNLCGVGVSCKAHACTLAADSSSSLYSGGLFGSVLPLVLSGNNSLTVCKPNTLIKPYVADHFDYIVGPPALTLDPVKIPGGFTVCVDVLRSSGWCDCSGNGIKLNTDFCQDRIVAGGVLPDACGANGPNTDDTQGNTGTKVGRVKSTPSGSSGAGDCINFFTTQFTVHTTNASFGPDGVACTSDDTVAPNAPAAVPLTTGTASATIKHAKTGLPEGGCSNDSGQTCVEDLNCGAGNQCNNPAPSIDATHTETRGPGAKTSCAKYEGGDLSGLSFVGAFPAAGGGPPLGDTVTAFTLHCE